VKTIATAEDTIAQKTEETVDKKSDAAPKTDAEEKKSDAVPEADDAEEKKSDA
jgi:hypothetical protein